MHCFGGKRLLGVGHGRSFIEEYFIREVNLARMDRSRKSVDSGEVVLRGRIRYHVPGTGRRSIGLPVKFVARAGDVIPQDKYRQLEEAL
ncbi:MAG: hypothetical protein KDD92_17965 [Caldilineaceae bacterium]|nr:hypothetical protein [Caldilineaceae bacterium]